MFDFLKRLAGAKPEQPAAHNTRLVRSFSAAQVSRVLAPWKGDGGFSNTEIAAALSTIRQRSRDMEKNSEHYLRWLDLFGFRHGFGAGRTGRHPQKTKCRKNHHQY